MSNDAGPLQVTAWPFIPQAAGSDEMQVIVVSWTGRDGPPPDIATIEGTTYRLSWQGEYGSGDSGQGLRCLLTIPREHGRRTVRVQAARQGGSPAREVAASCTVRDARHWELCLMMQSHVDIGYTEHPDILADAHGEYIAKALDIMSASDDRPPEEQFRWTCEGSWTVEQFLRLHPERATEFVRRAQEGRLEVTALYANLTDLFSEDLLRRSVEYAVALCKKYRIPLSTACNHDVNGWGWALPRILRDVGVRYLSTAINETRALGVRPRPAPFRWEAPDGNGVLLWHDGSYLTGNTLRLHHSAREAEPLVASFLNRLVGEEYPHDRVLLKMSGIQGDSMPPTPGVCNVVADWNRRWEWPRLRLVTARDWFSHVESNWPRVIPCLRQAWPDWWADGNGSALYESALARATQARLADLETQRIVIREQLGVDLGRLNQRRGHISCLSAGAWWGRLLHRRSGWADASGHGSGRRHGHRLALRSKVVCCGRHRVCGCRGQP